jgi:hypothetical protein
MALRTSFIRETGDTPSESLALLKREMKYLEDEATAPYHRPLPPHV